MVARKYSSSAKSKLAPGRPCSYCRVSAATSLDHIVPFSKGGRGTRSNTTPACTPCNVVKGAESVGMFRAWLLTEAGAKWALDRWKEPSVGQRLFRSFMGERRVQRSSLTADWPRGGRDDYEGPDR